MFTAITGAQRSFDLTLGLHHDDRSHPWPQVRLVPPSVERRYYVSSLPPDAARIANAVRSHWRIENTMHWVLDMAFGEDQCRVRVENAAQNFAILRRIVLNLLKADTQTKAGIKNRRLKACANDNYRAVRIDSSKLLPELTCCLT